METSRGGEEVGEREERRWVREQGLGHHKTKTRAIGNYEAQRERNSSSQEERCALHTGVISRLAVNRVTCQNEARLAFCSVGLPEGRAV